MATALPSFHCPNHLAVSHGGAGAQAAAAAYL